MRTNASSGWGAGLLAIALSALAGCSLQVPFELTWELPVAGPPGALGVEVSMDLSQAAELWSRRDEIDDVSVARVRLQVTRLGSRNRAETMSLVVRYRPEGGTAEGDLELVEVAEFLLTEGELVEVSPQPGLGAALRDALEGSGRFALVVSGGADQLVEASVTLSLAGTALVAP